MHYKKLLTDSKLQILNIILDIKPKIYLFSYSTINHNINETVLASETNIDFFLKNYYGD